MQVAVVLCMILLFLTKTSRCTNITQEEDTSVNTNFDQDEDVSTEAEPLLQAGRSLLDPRIINGYTAKIDKFPYQVALRTKTRFACGGSLISRTWVLTAAHCVYKQDPQLYVLAGKEDWRNNNDAKSVVQRVIHPLYNPNTHENDIALLKIKPVTYTRVVKNIQLPPSSWIKEKFIGKTVVVSGWGQTSYSGGASNTLKYARVSVISNEVCQKPLPYAHYPQHICAQSRNNQGGCFGDSGGPLVIESNGRQVQIGIVKSVYPGCSTAHPTVFTRVTNYLAWIRRVAGI